MDLILREAYVNLTTKGREIKAKITEKNEYQTKKLLHSPSQRGSVGWSIIL